MKDMQSQLEKLRTDAAECALIRDLATDPKKRELFTKLADHLSVLASEVERAIAELAAYYQTYQKAPPLDARHFARLKLHDIVASGHSCGDVGEG